MKSDQEHKTMKVIHTYREHCRSEETYFSEFGLLKKVYIYRHKKNYSNGKKLRNHLKALKCIKNDDKEDGK